MSVVLIVSSIYLFLRKDFERTKTQIKQKPTNKTKISEQKTTNTTIFGAEKLLRRWKSFVSNSEKCKTVKQFLKIPWEKSFWNFKMKHCIFKSNCLKSWNTSSSSSKLFFEKVVLKLLVFSGDILWWSVIFYLC